jgi:hypothetical protein
VEFPGKSTDFIIVKRLGQGTEVVVREFEEFL